MRWFSLLPEARVRVVRWCFLIGWLLLILLLIHPALAPWELSPACRQAEICRPGIGNDLFWNFGLPAVVLAVLASHELWRRICPLSFVSQLFRALGWQRTVLNASGRKQLVTVAEDSWLGRHHVQLQWSLLIAGLSLRILVANSSALVLALLCLAALTGALASGWAWSGKAWCHYLCPFGPAQQVITGPRSLMGSEAHIGSPTKTTQSMCRTVGAEGKDISSCVACVRPCLDIDSERTYWQTLTGQRGLQWAWYSYPGLVLAFYLLIYTAAPAGVDYVRSNLFTYDRRLAAMALQSIAPAGWPAVPRLVAIPALLSLGCLASVALFQRLQALQQQRLGDRPADQARDIALHRTRLLATYTAVNTFFFFKSNLFGFAGKIGDHLFQLVIIGITSTWLYRSWFRDRSLYERESTSTSLRKQLAKLGTELEDLLAGRRLDDLSPGEVFVLAKALPAQAVSQRRRIYLDVLRDLILQGRLERTASLMKLAELRTTLGLDENDHQAAMQLLASEDARLQSLNARELQGLDLRLSAAAEEIEDLLRLSGLTMLHLDRLDPYARERLERIRTESSLDDEQWNELLARYGPASAYSERHLERLRESLGQAQARRESLMALGSTLPQVMPLVLTLDHQISRLLPPMVQLILTMLEGREDERPDPSSLALLGALSPNVLAFLSNEDETTLTLTAWLDGQAVWPQIPAPLPDPAAVLEELWLDADPNVALWALMVQRRLQPERAEAMRRQPRSGQPGGAFLDAFLRGEPLAGSEILTLLADLPLIGRFEPGVLLGLHRLGTLRHWSQGDRMDPGDDAVLVLLRGACEQRRRLAPGSPPRKVASEEAGAILGLVDYFGERRAGERPLWFAAAPGCVALAMSRVAFRELLDVSPIFQQTVIRDLAVACESLQRSLQDERQNRVHERMRARSGQRLAGPLAVSDPPPPEVN